MRAQLLAPSLIVFVTLACASAHTRPLAENAPVPPDATRTALEQYGLIGLPFGAVGEFFFLAGATPDSTRVIFAAGLVPLDGLDLDVTRGGAVLHSFHMHSGTFVQTTTLAPGVYDLTSGQYQQSIVVPRLGATSIAQPIPMHPTAIIGRDTSIGVIVETYGASDAPVTLSAPGWCDTLTLRRNGNVSRDTIQVPLARLAPGPTTLVLSRGHDTGKSTVFMGFSYAPVLSFDRTLDALRYLAPAARLDSLRQRPPDERPRAWADLLAQYKERLPEYLERVREANRRYSEPSVSGWETDRGSAYVQLGDPDQVFVEPDIEIWVYTRYFGRLKFDHRRLVPESRHMLTTLVAQARSAR